MNVSKSNPLMALPNLVNGEHLPEDASAQPAKAPVAKPVETAKEAELSASDQGENA